MEVKADSLEESFAALQQEDSVQQLRTELNGLKEKLRQNLITAGRPLVGDEQKSGSDEQFGRFLRSGEQIEGKSLDNVSGAAGGLAIPREIDEVIDRTLTAISPIRRIANVVRIGSSNYRKLITTGGNLSLFAAGSLRWLSGPNAGLTQQIVTASENRLGLRESPPFPVEPGTSFEVKQGCDGRLATCEQRFCNVANFRGEPHLPGTDFIMRYSGD
jgi:hypothetical protein